MTRPILLQIDANDAEDAIRARLERAKAAGFAGFEWLIDSVSGENDSGFDADEWRPPLCAGDPESHAVSLRLSHSDTENLLGLCRKWLACATGLNAGLLTLRLPGLSPDDPTVGLASYQGALNRSYSLLRELHFEAESAGVVLSLLVPQDGFLISPVEARELIDRVNAWNVGATVDIERVRPVGYGAGWLQTLRSRVQGVVVGSRAAGGSDDRPRVSPDELFGALHGFVPGDRPLILGAAISESDWPQWLGRAMQLQQPASTVEPG